MDGSSKAIGWELTDSTLYINAFNYNIIVPYSFTIDTYGKQNIVAIRANGIKSDTNVSEDRRIRVNAHNCQTLHILNTPILAWSHQDLGIFEILDAYEGDILTIDNNEIERFATFFQFVPTQKTWKISAQLGSRAFNMAPVSFYNSGEDKAVNAKMLQIKSNDRTSYVLPKIFRLIGPGYSFVGGGSTTGVIYPSVMLVQKGMVMFNIDMEAISSIYLCDGASCIHLGNWVVVLPLTNSNVCCFDSTSVSTYGNRVLRQWLSISPKDMTWYVYCSPDDHAVFNHTFERNLMPFDLETYNYKRNISFGMVFFDSSQRSFMPVTNNMPKIYVDYKRVHKNLEMVPTLEIRAPIYRTPVYLPIKECTILDPIKIITNIDDISLIEVTGDRLPPLDDFQNSHMSNLTSLQDDDYVLRGGKIDVRKAIFDIRNDAKQIRCISGDNLGMTSTEIFFTDDLGQEQHVVYGYGIRGFHGYEHICDGVGIKCHRLLFTYADETHKYWSVTHWLSGTHEDPIIVKENQTYELYLCPIAPITIPVFCDDVDVACTMIIDGLVPNPGEHNYYCIFEIADKRTDPWLILEKNSSFVLHGANGVSSTRDMLNLLMGVGTRNIKIKTSNLRGVYCTMSDHTSFTLDTGVDKATPISMPRTNIIRKYDTGYKEGITTDIHIRGVAGIGGSIEDGVVSYPDAHILY